MALVSLVVPTYNEAENIVELLDRVRAAMEGRALEVWVVDDDSPDRTWERAGEYGNAHSEVRVVRRRGERGLSSAVVAGFRRSHGGVLAVMDADLSHDPRLLPKLADAVEAGADLSVGSRRVAGGGADTWPWYRRRTSDLATAAAKWWLRVELSDPMSGYFALKREVYDRLADRLQPRGYKILLEIAVRAGPLRLEELPFVFKDRHQGHSKLTPAVAWDFLASLWELRRRSKEALAEKGE